MNIGIYSMRDDEVDYVRQMEESLGIHILTTSEDPSVDNVDFLGGCEGVSVLGAGLHRQRITGCMEGKRHPVLIHKNHRL